MNARERIEEAHGLWELAIARVAAFTEIIVSTGKGASNALIRDAVVAERKAFYHWQEVSKLALQERAK